MKNWLAFSVFFIALLGGANSIHMDLLRIDLVEAGCADERWEKAGKIPGHGSALSMEETAEGFYAGAGTLHGEVFFSENGEDWSLSGAFESASGVYALKEFTRDNSRVLMAGTKPAAEIFEYEGGEWTESYTLFDGGVDTINDFEEKNSDVFLVAVENKVYRSENSGHSWLRISPFQSQNRVNDLLSVDGFVYAATGPHGAVVTSSDAINWKKKSIISRFANANALLDLNGAVYVAGDTISGKGAVYKTENKAENWETVYLFEEKEVTALTAGEDEVMYAAVQGVKGAGIYRSKNYGTTWSKMDGFPEGLKVNFLFRAEDGTVYAGTGPEGEIYRTVCFDRKAVCEEGEEQECTTLEGCRGIKVCENGSFTACRKDPEAGQLCSPGTKVKCTPTVNGKPCPAVEAEQECNACGTSYGKCETIGEPECCPGEKEACFMGGEEGDRTCGENAKWLSCGVFRPGTAGGEETASGVRGGLMALLFGLVVIIIVLFFGLKFLGKPKKPGSKI